MNDYTLELMTDYTTYTYESCIDTLRYYQALEVTNMKIESDFILSCLESGYIDMHYEVDSSLVSTMENIIGSLMNAIENFFKKLGEMFSTKARELSKKYKKWVEFAEGKILERAKNMKLDMFPYIEGDWEKDATLISNKAKEAINNYKSKSYNYKYMSPFVSVNNKGDTESMKVKLENYFKFKRKDSLGIKGQTRYAGQDLVKVVSSMCEYVKNYDTKVLNTIGDCCQEIADSISGIASNDSEETNESINANTFITVEGKYLCETELISMINYPDIIAEDSTNTTDNKDNKPQHVTNDGEVTTKDTAVTVEPNDNQDNKDKEGKTTSDVSNDDKKSKENEERTEYLKKTESLLKLLTSTYTTACEQRYLAYIVALKAIGDGSGTPKFDKDGNWIEPSTEEEIKKNKQIADNDKVGKKGVVQTIKDFFSSKSQAKAEKQTNKKT